MALIDTSIEVQENITFMPTESMIENNIEKENRSKMRKRMTPLSLSNNIKTNCTKHQWMILTIHLLMTLLIWNNLHTSKAVDLQKKKHVISNDNALVDAGRQTDVIDMSSFFY